MVPCTWVPFFSSMVTVSWLSFIKNLGTPDRTDLAQFGFMKQEMI